jgi:hypothetical protein
MNKNSAGDKDQPTWGDVGEVGGRQYVQGLDDGFEDGKMAGRDEGKLEGGLIGAAVTLAVGVAVAGIAGLIGLAFQRRSDVSKQAIDENSSRKLVVNSMLGLAEAISTKDFTSFYGEIAKLWQAQTTADNLKAAFQHFMDMGTDFSGIKTVQPFLFVPAKLENGQRLVLKGHYPTKPLRVQFALTYALEGSDWKLVGIKVSSVPE